MDMTSLMLSLVAGLVGMAMLMYAKSSGRLVPMGAGLGLVVCPYLIPHAGVLLVTCAALIAVPFVFRDA